MKRDPLAPLALVAVVLLAIIFVFDLWTAHQAVRKQREKCRGDYPSGLCEPHRGKW